MSACSLIKGEETMKQPTIKAIETAYNGYLFRSTLWE
jgi:hypothetical protein